MATTGLGIVKRAMRLIGALGRGETPTDDEQTDGLAALNAMLDSWSIQELNVFQTLIASYTWSAGQASQTIGPSGADFTAARPVELVGAYQRSSDIDYPLHVLTEGEYAAISDKTTQSDIISRIFYNPSNPSGTLYAYPVPSGAATVFLRTWQVLQTFDAATEQIALPPGYEDALVFNLALSLAPEYQRQVPFHVARRAANTLRVLKRRNLEIPSARMDVALVTNAGGGGAYNWNVGE